MAKKNWAFENVLIFPQLQIRLMACMILGFGASLLISFFTNLYFIESLFSFGRKIGLPTEHPYFQLIKNEQSALTGLFALTGCISLVVCSLLSLWVSRRIATAWIKETKEMSTTGKPASRRSREADLALRSGIQSDSNPIL